MSGVLPFFFNAALKLTVDTKNCTFNNETVAPTYDLILNITFMGTCEGALGILNNLATYIIFIVVLVILLRGWKWIQPVKKWIPDELIIITLGLVIGVITRFAATENVFLSSEFQDNILAHRLMIIEELRFFFIPMLILNGAYELHNAHIFRHLDDIIILAVVGTIINIGGTVLFLKGLNHATDLPYKPSDLPVETIETTTVSWSQFLVFATVLGAADHVALFPVYTEINTEYINNFMKVTKMPIFYVLFGESSLNSVLHYTMFSGLVKMLNFYDYGVDQEFPTESMLYFLLSLATGPIFAGLIACVMVCLSSGISKVAGDHTKDFLPYIVTGFVWLGWYMVDRMGFSSIFYIIFCAVLQARYTFPNITYPNRRIIKGMLRTHATVIEIALFALIGYEVAIEMDLNSLGYAFICLLVLISLRAVSVLGLFRLINYRRSKEDQFGLEWQFSLILRRLRGPLILVMALEAYCGKSHPQHKVFMSSLFTVAFLITVFYGIIAKPAIENIINRKQLAKLAKKEDITGMVQLLSSSAGETMREVIGSGLISGTSHGNLGFYIAVLDNKIKEWLLKDRKSRQRQNRIDYRDEMKEAIKWLNENPTELERVQKEREEKKEH